MLKRLKCGPGESALRCDVQQKGPKGQAAYVANRANDREQRLVRQWSKWTKKRTTAIQARLSDVRPWPGIAKVGNDDILKVIRNSTPAWMGSTFVRTMLKVKWGAKVRLGSNSPQWGEAHSMRRIHECGPSTMAEQGGGKTQVPGNVEAQERERWGNGRIEHKLKKQQI